MFGFLKSMSRWGSQSTHELSIEPEPHRQAHWGIARLKVGLGSSLTLSRAPRLVVEGANGSARSELALMSGDHDVLVGIHTHLLGNGPQSLELTAMDGKKIIGRGNVTLNVTNSGKLADTVAISLRQHGVPFAFIGPCDSSYYPANDPKATPWFDRPDAIDEVNRRLREGKISGEEAKTLHQFVDKGYVILEELIDDETVDEVNREIDDAVAQGWQGYQYGSSQRLELLHLHYPAIRRLWLDPRHLRVLELIFGVPARPCQTLTYVFGSQQDAHQDAVYLTPFPAGYMCGTWIALQDVVPNSGELIVYPGSHREPRAYLSNADCSKVRDGNWAEFWEKVLPIWAAISRRYEPVVYRPKKGTVLIWHENLLHAGSARIDQSLARRSIVVHSFAQGTIAYYDSSGMVGIAHDPSEEVH
jgi:ectoine hydroxylase-related dioxygenase (phytanoyl-CoA dioxygenase family)